MSRRIVEVNSLFFEWPVGATRPSSYAILATNLERYLAASGPARTANAAEAASALEANLAGPNGRKLSAQELARCYRDVMGYELFHRAEGVNLPSEARS